jgi:hypothetical protein
MHGSTDSTSDEEPIASMKPKQKKKTKTKTKSATINNLPPNKAIAGTSTASTNNKSASKTSTAATDNATIPDDVANANPPKKRKAKKNATKTALPTRRNTKCKKDLDEGTVDRNFPNPPVVEDHVPTHVCNWAQAIVCNFPQLPRRNVSILIVTFLFITYFKLPGSKGKGIQIPSHVTAAVTTHTTNTKMLLIGLVYRRSPCLATLVAKCQLFLMQP